ncbi:MAG: glycosyltransferase family 2 protein [Deltaproteobacteria bacterium]|nr:glycosyltransferase family 2 protein [Deltaproteobacteria bacterium]
MNHRPPLAAGSDAGPGASAAKGGVRLSVLVVNWNSRDDLAACLASLRPQLCPELEVIVVDNGSHDGSAALVRESFPWCVLLAEADNLGFAEACNRGIAASTGEWVVTLNNDTVVDKGWVQALLGAAAQAPRDCGMLQPLLLFQDGGATVNSTGIELTTHGGGRDRGAGAARGALRAAPEVFCPTAGAAAYRRSMLEAVRLSCGYFDRHYFMYYEDLDLGWRASLAGWRARFVPEAVVHHRHHGSSDRHGRAWLVALARTNRIRTLVKNASWRFIATTAPYTLSALAEIVWHGGLPAGWRLLGAVRRSAAARGEVETLRRLPRREVERRWVRR